MVGSCPDKPIVNWKCKLKMHLMHLPCLTSGEGDGTHSSALAWKIHGQRSLVGCSPWGRKESDTTEWLHFHFSLSCIGEGNGNPLQCSCLENPRDEGAWWAAVYGVAQSRTRLKRLSSSSMIFMLLLLLLLLLSRFSHVRLCATP